MEAVWQEEMDLASRISGRKEEDESEEDTYTQIIEGKEYFCEIALFVNDCICHASLTAATRAECYLLQGEDLLATVSANPTCTSVYCEYARSLVEEYQKMGENYTHVQETLVTKACSQKISLWQMMYPEQKTRFENIDLFGTASEQGSENGEEIEEESLKRKDHLGIFTRRLFSEDASSLSLEEMEEEMVYAIPELDSTMGTHVLFDQENERKRVISANLSTIALTLDRWDLFTEPQNAKVKLSKAEWQELQDIMAWIKPDETQLKAVLVLHSIRPLGKPKSLLSQVPMEHQRPDSAVRWLMWSQPNVVPSVLQLEDTEDSLVKNALRACEIFNFAQMLQGENTPANVSQLYNMMAELEEMDLKFYILYLLGFMSGLAGGKGSVFMNSKNTRSILDCIQHLQRLFDSPPRAVYWGYMESRAKRIGIRLQDRSECALTRLACLCRVTDKEGYIELKNALNFLNWTDREIMVDHFLADGIEVTAFLFEFLPQCLANAKANPYIQLSVMLETLVDLIVHLRSAVLKEAKVKTLFKQYTVNLLDMAEFVGAVQNRFVFQACVARSKVIFKGIEVLVDMSAANWARIGQEDTDLTLVAYKVQEVLRRVKAEKQVTDNSEFLADEDATLNCLL